MASILRAGSITVEPVVEITGDERCLWAFECRTDWGGGATIRTCWSVGEPIAHAPQHWEEEYCPAGDFPDRVIDLAILLTENVAVA